MDGLSFRLYTHYNGKYDEETYKCWDGKGTLYLMLLSMVLMKLAFHQEDCDVKLFETEKSLYTIKSNENLEVAFDKYVTRVIHMVTIYTEREDKYILKRRNEDEGAELEKQRWIGHIFDEYMIDMTHHYTKRCIILAAHALHHCPPHN